MTGRILVVEDDPAILRGLRDNLQGEAYDVLTASDGETAYRLIRDERPDLVVLDVMLPQLSGLELCQRVRGEGVITPILMLTAQEAEQDRVKGLDAGADDYVTKPFLLQELLARVRGLLRQRRDWRGQHDELTRDVRSAAEVQQRLLPREMPRLATVDCSALCDPARGVGGDYYDLIDVGAGLTALLLADVAGKGITAALTMASLQGMLRAEAPRYGTRCGELGTAVNAALHAMLAPGRYVTVFYGVYDEAHRRLFYINAGHPAPILLRGRAAAPGSLDASIPPLGLFCGVTPATECVRLEPGDWLLAFSDGVTEAMNAKGEEFGRDRLLEVARRHSSRSAEEMRDGVHAAVRQHASGRPQADDITLLAGRIL